MVTVVVSGANQPAQLIIFGNLLDSFNDDDKARAVRLVHFFALLYAIVGVQQFVTVTLQTTCATRVAATQARRIREHYFEALMRLPIAWFDSENQGAVAASVLEATLAIQDGLGEKLTTGLQGLLAFVLGLAVAFYYAWSLTLVSISVLPIIAALLTFMSTAEQRAQRASTEASTEASALASEALVNVRTVAAFGAERRTLDRYWAKASLSASKAIDLGVAQGSMAGLVALILYGTWALGLWYGSYLIRRDMAKHDHCNYRVSEDGSIREPSKRQCVTGGEVMTAFLCVLFGGLSLLQALPGLAAVQLAQREASRVFKVIDGANKIIADHDADCARKMRAKNAETMIMYTDDDDKTQNEGAGLVVTRDGSGAAAIEFDCVKFAYPSRPDRTVYSSLTFRLEAGQSTALVGHSGCGKSTAVSLILRFYDVAAGAVRFGGRDVRSMDVGTLRAQIGLVSQEPVLFSGSILENISYGAPPEGGAPTREDVEAAARMANAHDFATSFPEGYDTEVGECGVQLSGGQKQRVAIARALIRKPLALILDEATSALDAKSEKVVQAALDEVVGGGSSSSRTTLIIAHRLSTIRRADKICVFANGEVIEEGSHDDLMALDAHYAALVGAQLATSESSASISDLAAAAAAPVAVADVDVEESKAPAEAVVLSPPPVASAVVVDGDTKAAESTAVVEEKDPPEEEDDEEENNNNNNNNNNNINNNKDGGAATGDEEEARKSTTNSVVVAWLWHFARRDYGWAGLGFFGAAVGGAAQPLLGLLMAEFIASFFEERRRMRLEAKFWALMFVAMGGAAALGELAKAYGLTRVCERVVCAVRQQSLEAMLRQPIAWHDANSAGTLAARLSQDCSVIRALVGQRIAQSIAMVVIVVLGLSISFEASWQLTLVTLGIIPLIILPIAVTAKFVMRAADAATESLQRAGGVASEAILHVRTVRAFGIERSVSARFDDYLAVPEHQAIYKGFMGGIGAGTAAAAVLFGAAFQYYIGGIFFRKGIVDFDELMKVLLVVIFLAFGLGAVSGDAVDKAEALQSAKKIYALANLHSPIDPLAAEDDDDEGGGAAAEGKKNKNKTMMAPASALDTAAAIEFRDVKFAYPARPDRLVYTGLSLSIAPNSTVALVGESGCGKSTAVQLLLRYYDVTLGGAVTLDGVDVRDVPVHCLRAQIGLVSQEPVLFSGTIADNIRYGRPGASLDEIIGAAKLANAHGFIDGGASGIKSIASASASAGGERSTGVETGEAAASLEAGLPERYETLVGERGVQLSGGQKQRIAIARALIRAPRVLILDEATSALDAQSERVVQCAIDHLIATSKCTTIVIAHRLSTIRNADAIAVLSRDGVVVEHGSHDDLIQRRGHYYSLVLHNDATPPPENMDDGPAVDDDSGAPTVVGKEAP